MSGGCFRSAWLIQREKTMLAGESTHRELQGAGRSWKDAVSGEMEP